MEALCFDQRRIKLLCYAHVESLVCEFLGECSVSGGRHKTRRTLILRPPVAS